MGSVFGTAGRDGWRRLHPAGLIVAMVQSVKTTVSSIISLALLFRIIPEQWRDWAMWATAAAAVLIAAGRPIATWATTRYRLDEDSITLVSGLIFRNRRTVGYDKVHAINSASPVYLQPFHVVQLTVSTEGMDESSITLDAVPAALQLELETVRARFLADGRSRGESTADGADGADGADAAAGAGIGSAIPATVEASGLSGVSSSERPATDGTSRGQDQGALNSGGAPVFRASATDIVLFAITDLGFLAAAFVVYGFISQLRDVLPKRWLENADQSVDRILARGLASIVMMAALCLIVLLIVSVVSSLLRFHGFEVWRRGDDLVVVRGLPTRRVTTVPVSRIQTIVIRQSVLRRPFRLCSVGLGLSSSTSGEDNGEGSLAVANILPVIGTPHVVGVLRAMLPEWDLHQPDIHRTGRGLARYYLGMPVAVGTMATGGAGAVFALLRRMSVIDISYWWLAVPLIACACWSTSRWFASRIEGFALPDGDRPEGTTRETGSIDDAGADAGAPGVPACHEDGRACVSVLPHRIAATGVRGVSCFTVFTRRSHVQSFRRSTTAWRAPLGIERVVMPLFVMNGLSELRFRFIRREDADRLACWAEQ